MMAGDPSENRTEFLIAYYKVLWDNINRHIQGVWKTVATLGISVALFGLVGNGSLSLAVATTLIIGVCMWFSATVYDSALWFARNQAIATNVERLFLDDPGDRELIQPYFAKHRTGLLISHFHIPLFLSRGLVLVAIVVHYTISSVQPDPLTWLPYVATAAYVVAEIVCWCLANRSYSSLLRKAPGKGLAEEEVTPVQSASL